MINNRWHATRLKYAADVNVAVLPENTDDDFELVYIDIGNVTQGAMDTKAAPIRFADAPSRARRLAKPGDSVVSTVRTYLRAVATVPSHDEPLVFSTGFAVLSPCDEVHPRFLPWYLQSDEFVSRVEAHSTGVSYPAITATQLVALDLRLPPFEEQGAIADYLDRETTRIDTLIEEQQRLIELLRERRASEIAAQFTGAATIPLRQVVEYAQTGPFGTQLTGDEYIDGGIPVINPTHIQRGRIVPDDSTTVTPEKAEELTLYRLTVGDIVLGRKGEVDKSALVDRRSTGYVCGSDTMILRPRSGTVPDYLWWFLQSTEAHSQLEFWSVGATVRGLNQTTIRKVRLPLPDEQEQRRVVSHLYEKTAKTDALIAETERFIELARERRAALITAAVTGQIDVREMA